MIRSERMGRQPHAVLQGRKGGLIVIGGPPFQGKNLLATRVSEHLPNSVKLEAMDNLSTAQECWYPQGPVGERVERPAGQMLEAARRIWERRELSSLPVIILTARFETARSRARAARMARRCDMPFLFVEARSSNIRSMRRIPLVALDREEVLKRYERFERAMARYEPVAPEEAETLECLCLGHVLSDLDAAVTAVLSRWLT